MDAELLKALLEDIAVAVDSWTTAAGEVLTDPHADVEWTEDGSALRELRGALSAVGRTHVDAAMFELMTGLAHSILAVFDGATASAEIGAVSIRDERGEDFEGAFHEKFIEHLFVTGRMI